MSKLGKQAAGNLGGHVEEIETLEKEKLDIGKEIRKVYTKAKGDGFSRPALRAVISRRRKGKQKCVDQDALIKTYEQALGLTPLEVAAAGEDEHDDDGVISEDESTEDTPAPNDTQPAAGAPA